MYQPDRSKDWVGDEPANRPASVAVKLQQKTADGTWTDADTAKYPHQTLTNDGSGTFSTATWAKLPKKDATEMHFPIGQWR